MKYDFKIIKCSEANVDWGLKDNIYHGPVEGLVAGFNFEIANKDGDTDYMSATYIYETPNDYINNLCYDYFDTVKWKGYEPTGRAIFRGYGVECYDIETNEWYVSPIEY